MQHTIVEEQHIILSKVSTEALLAIMENPPKPNDNLKKAMQRRKDLISQGKLISR
ncbi:MAG: DUF1778 domain-containing protein [Deltaproteobacteria bacterium]